MNMLRNKVSITGTTGVVVTVTVWIGFFFALVGFAAFFNVSITGEPRWQESCWNESLKAPWYYHGSFSYSLYNFISGSLFLIVTLLTLSARIQKRRLFAIMGSFLIIILAIAEYISSLF